MIITPLLDRPERITLAFRAETLDAAIAAAKAWAADRPLRIKTVCSVRRSGERWAVTLAVRWLP